jgi:hypothetical protein
VDGVNRERVRDSLNRDRDFEPVSQLLSVPVKRRGSSCECRSCSSRSGRGQERTAIGVPPAGTRGGPRSRARPPGGSAGFLQEYSRSLDWGGRRAGIGRDAASSRPKWTGVPGRPAASRCAAPLTRRPPHPLTTGRMDAVRWVSPLFPLVFEQGVGRNRRHAIREGG